MRRAFPILLASFVLLTFFTRAALAQSDPAGFTTVINLPDDQVELTDDIAANTQVNVYTGGETAPGLWSDRFEVGPAGDAQANAELNVIGGTVGRYLGVNAGGTLNVYSGGVGDEARAEPGSRVNLYGGRVGDRFAAVGAEVLIDGGQIDFDATFIDGAKVTMRNGAIYRSMLLFNATMDVYGGQIDSGADIQHFGVMNLHGGTVLGEIDLHDTGVLTVHQGNLEDVLARFGSTLFVHGGTVRDEIKGWGGVVNFTGGSVRAISIRQGSVVNLSGGQPNTLDVFSQSTSSSVNTLNVFGGMLPDERVFVRSGAAVNFYGTEFSLDGNPLEGLTYGLPVTIPHRDAVLAGTLTDGSPLSYLLAAEYDSNIGLLFEAGAQVTITPVLAGDYNLDQVVDAADYTLWRDHLGTSTTLPGDTTPGEVSMHDYLVWRENYGAVYNTTAPAPAHAAPEPQGVCLIAAANLAAFCYRRGWRDPA